MELFVDRFVETEVKLDVVLTIAAVVELDDELVLTTEDKFNTGEKVELKTVFVKGTEELRLLESWYKLNPFGPPQISWLFAAHAILHRPSVAVILPLLKVFPQ